MCLMKKLTRLFSVQMMIKECNQFIKYKQNGIIKRYQKWLTLMML